MAGNTFSIFTVHPQQYTEHPQQYTEHQRYMKTKFIHSAFTVYSQCIHTAIHGTPIVHSFTVHPQRIHSKFTVYVQKSHGTSTVTMRRCPAARTTALALITTDPADVVTNGNVPNGSNPLTQFIPSAPKHTITCNVNIHAHDNMQRTHRMVCSCCNVQCVYTFGGDISWQCVPDTSVMSF